MSENKGQSRIARVATATFALMAAQMVAGALLMRDQPQVPGAFPWALLSSLLTAALAVFVSESLAGTRTRRIGVLFVLLFGIPANYLAEAYFFDISIPPALLVRIYAFQLLVNAALAAVVGSWSGASAEGPARAPLSAASAAARLGLSAVAYVVAYFTAGLTAYPFLSDFYAGRAMPGIPRLFLIQTGRGLAFALVVLVLARVFRGTRARLALTAGLALSIIGGIAPLIVPNAFLPTPVRLVHLVEVAVSNFLFGAFAGWLLAGSVPRAEEVRGDVDLPALDAKRMGA